MNAIFVRLELWRVQCIRLAVRAALMRIAMDRRFKV